MNKIKLPEKLDRTACTALGTAFAAAIAENPAIDVEASAVERMGQSGLQLLVSAAISCEQRGGTLTFSEPSAAMVDSFRRAALAEWLEERV